MSPLRTRCWSCGRSAWMAYHATRTVMTLDGLCQVILKVRRCENPVCALYHQPYRPEEETARNAVQIDYQVAGSHCASLKLAAPSSSSPKWLGAGPKGSTRACRIKTRQTGYAI